MNERKRNSVGILIITLVLVVILTGCSKEYVITFNTDGGSEIERQLIPYGKSGQEPTPPTKDHYYFLGWYHSGSEYIFDAETITEDITVTARWAYTFHGLGTIENPFLLETKDDVEMFSSLINEDSTNPVNGEPYYFAHYRLANDIDMLDGEIEPLLNFQGTFDGNNKTIKNLVLKTGSLENTGFFGSVIGTKDETSGLIKNFTLDNVQISGERANNANIGLLVGYAYGATIVGCKATGTITLNKNRMEKAVIGGLVGRANYSLINATFVEVDILGGDVVGGIAGYITEETVVSSSYVAQGSTIQLYRGGSLSGLVGNVDSGCIVVSSLTLATLKNSDYTTSNLSKQFKF